MKKVLIASILFNILFISVFAYRRFKPKVSVPEFQTAYFEARKQLYRSLPVDSNDIVFIGNSITEQFPVTELFGPDVKNRGVAGNRAINVLDRIDDIVKGRPKKIFLMIGVNDIKDGAPIDQVLFEVTGIIDKIQDRSPETKIYVQSTLPTAKEYGRLDAEIFRYNSRLNAYCDKHQLTYIDLYKSFDKNFVSLTYDGLHLNEKGHELWMNEIKTYIK